MCCELLLLCFMVVARLSERRSRFAMGDQGRLFADPEKAARRIVEIAGTVESVQDGRSMSS